MYAIFRMRMLEFRPEVLAGDVILPRDGKAAGSAARLLLPLQFSNGGCAGGIGEEKVPRP